jgi:elongator complex protein 2
VLGLSNKATTDSTDDNPTILLDTLTTPPLEDHLSRYTLSPELEKLYAHPSEIIAVSTSHSGKFIASTCKSSTLDNAVIRIFDTTTYSEITILKAHSLTITKLAWSKDDSFLISVGRDRQWTIFQTEDWKVIKLQGKAHARIIWDISISPIEFGKIFVTGSRDKTVKIWDGEKNWNCICTVKFSEAVTSCAFLYEVVRNMAFIAVGLENGGIYVLGCEKGSEHYRVVKNFDERYKQLLDGIDFRITHSDAVTGLAWRPGVGRGVWELASCGDDCSVRIYEVQLDTKTTNGE